MVLNFDASTLVCFDFLCTHRPVISSYLPKRHLSLTSLYILPQLRNHLLTIFHSLTEVGFMISQPKNLKIEAEKLTHLKS